MIWLVGNKGMLGHDVEEALQGMDYVATDKDVDIRDIEILKKFVKDKNIKWIINCAAYTDVDSAEDNQDLAFSINTDGASNLAIIAKLEGARMIHISTDYVYDGDKKDAHKESDICRPTNIYAYSKYLAEKHIDMVFKEYFIIRTSWLFGRHGKNFIKTILKKIEEKKDEDTINVVCDQDGSPTYTKDLAEFILTIINLNSSEFGIYNYSNSGRTNWYDFAFSIKCRSKYKDKNIEIEACSSSEFPTNAKRPANSWMSNYKAENTFKIKIPSWENALDRYFLEDDLIQFEKHTTNFLKKLKEYDAEPVKFNNFEKVFEKYKEADIFHLDEMENNEYNKIEIKGRHGNLYVSIEKLNDGTIFIETGNHYATFFKKVFFAEEFAEFVLKRTSEIEIMGK